MFDAIVIGAGSAGVRFARTAGDLGANIAVIEARYLGGTCVNVGCVPKKLFVYGSQLPSQIATAAGYGWNVNEPEFNWSSLRENKNREIARLNTIYTKLLERSGVTLIEGEAALNSPTSVTVNGREIEAKRIIIATGGWPVVPDVKGKEHFITSNQFFYLDELPKQATVLGGGYIAVEFAGILNGLGVETTLIYRGPLFLRGFEETLRSELAEQMIQRGVNLKFNQNIASIQNRSTAQARNYEVCLEDGSTLESQCIIACTGRNANIEHLGLQTVGVKLNKRKFIEVNESFQTNIPSIYALGDVIGRVALTPVALKEGMWLARHLFADSVVKESGEAIKSIPLDYSFIPTAVFSQPELATVGYSEVEAKSLFGEVEVYQSKFRPLKHTLTGKPEKSLMKMVVDKATQRVVGLHLLGEGASEIVQGFAVAMKMGATKAHFDETVGVHPTAAEELVTLR